MQSFSVSRSGEDASPKTINTAGGNGVMAVLGGSENVKVTVNEGTSGVSGWLLQ
jgi:hypothetical protein